MSVDHDPRVYFAAERTLLAWLRTGLAVMGLGFVVARFGLFLRMLANQHHDGDWHAGSAAIGITLVGIGAVSIGVGAWKHLRFCQTLSPAERPPRFWLGTSVWLALALAVLGAILAVYIAATSAVNQGQVLVGAIRPDANPPMKISLSDHPHRRYCNSCGSGLSSAIGRAVGASAGSTSASGSISSRLSPV